MNAHNSFFKSQKNKDFNVIILVFLLISILIAGFYFAKRIPLSQNWESFALVFVSIVLEAIPFMLIGSLVGGCIEVWISHERLTSILPKQKWIAVCLAACAGICFPVCECAVVPVVRRLINKGLPLSAAIAYLLGGPIINPIVAASSIMAYSGNLTIPALRIGFAFLISTGIGLAMGRIFPARTAIKTYQTIDLHNYLDKDILSTIPIHEHSCLCCTGTIDHENIQEESWIDKITRGISHAREDFLSVAHYLVIGALIAAIAHTHIDRSAISEIIKTPFASIIVMMGMAIALNLCSEADAFIAASFQNIIPINAQLAFLLTGPMFDLKLLLMYRTLFKPKAILIFSTMILLTIFLITATCCLGF